MLIVKRSKAHCVAMLEAGDDPVAANGVEYPIGIYLVYNAPEPKPLGNELAVVEDRNEAVLILNLLVDGYLRPPFAYSLDSAMRQAMTLEALRNAADPPPSNESQKANEVREALEVKRQPLQVANPKRLKS